MTNRLRVVFFGLDSVYSRVPLRAIAASHDVVGVYSDRSKQKGFAAVPYLRSKGIDLARRAMPRVFDSLAGTARELGIEHRVEDSLSADAVVAEIRALRPDVICIASLNRLLTASILSVPRLGTINAHASLLPDFRGPNTFFWMVKLDATHGGVTLHWATLAADAGEILARRPLRLYPGLDESDYYRALGVLAGDAFNTTLAELARDGAIAGEPNGASSTPYARNPRAEDLSLEINVTTARALWFRRVTQGRGAIEIVDPAGVRHRVERLALTRFAGASRIPTVDGEVWGA